MDKIDEKWQKLRASGLDLGPPLGTQDPLQAAIASQLGGAVRQYEHGNIYWHPVMGTEAYEVHGGILGRYLSIGGPGEDRITHQRVLGFPKSDEKLTRDGLYPVSYFEWGAIYWFWGGVALHGDLYHHWEEKNAESRQPPPSLSFANDRKQAVPFGYPIDDQQELADGQLVFFEHGCWWKGLASSDKLLGFSLTTPPIGRPAIWNSEASNGTPLPIQIRCDASFDTLAALKGNNRPELFSEIWRGRLFLQRVVAKGGPAEEIPVVCTQAPSEELGGEVFGPVNPVRCLLPPDRKLADRALYNIIYRNPETRRSFLIAPHAIYSKSSWDNFGIMHATDMHVSRRLEGFRALLQKADYPDGVALYNCFNDNFREVIRYADHLYDIGVLDLILATGDLVDYVFEKGENENGPGNFDLFRSLVLGIAPSTSPEVLTEELRVPIFTVPGNHDYRKYPYLLYFEAHAREPGLDRVFSKTLSNYESHNLTRLESLAVDNNGRRPEVLGIGLKPTVDTDEAAKMVAVDPRNSAYFKYVNDASDYLIRLGKNRVAMLNTKYDVGIVDTEKEAATIFLAMPAKTRNNSRPVPQIPLA